MLPCRHGAARARAKVTIDAGVVEPEPLQRDLQRVARGAVKLRLAAAGLLQGFFGYGRGFRERGYFGFGSCDDFGWCNKLGLGLPAADAIKWATLNPAKSLGLEDKIGSLKVGKNADLVLWDANPMSVYAHAEKVWIDGSLRFDRLDASVQPTSDFNLGILEAGEVRP